MTIEGTSSPKPDGMKRGAHESNFNAYPQEPNIKEQLASHVQQQKQLTREHGTFVDFISPLIDEPGEGLSLEETGTRIDFLSDLIDEVETDLEFTYWHESLTDFEYIDQNTVSRMSDALYARAFLWHNITGSLPPSKRLGSLSEAHLDIQRAYQLVPSIRSAELFRKNAQLYLSLTRFAATTSQPAMVRDIHLTASEILVDCTQFSELSEIAPDIEEVYEQALSILKEQEPQTGSENE